MMDLDDWLAHCERLHPKSMDFTLERVTVVRARLGLRFECPVISVAGTNGKGSTCAMLESILLAAGYGVGLYINCLLYTSPSPRDGLLSRMPSSA